MENVPHEGDPESGDAFFVFQDGEGIGEGLGGMFVHSIAGVDDGFSEESCGKIGGAPRAVPHHEGIQSFVSESQHGIFEGFPFGHTGTLHAEVGAFHLEVSCRLFKAEAGSGGVFQEEHSDDFAGEVRQFFALEIFVFKIL